jgi:hypothetical protein
VVQSCDRLSGNNRGRPSSGWSIGFEDCLNVEVPRAPIESLDQVAAVVGTGTIVGYHQYEVLVSGVIELPRGFAGK